MPSIHPHINFNGNAEAAFAFYQSVFGGAFSRIVRFKDMASPDMPIAEKEANKIMHIALPIGEHSLLMGNDVPELLGTVNEMEHRSKIAISASSLAEAEHLYNGLSAGGTVEYPLGPSPGLPLLGRGEFYFAMFRDQFGIEWMIDFEEKEE